MPEHAHRGIRVNHVVGAGQRHDLDTGALRSCGYVECNLVRYRIGQRGQARADHVVLGGRKPRSCDGRKHDERISSFENLGEDAELHQILPPTSASATRLPLSTERAIATIARTDARPSSIVAPVIGSPLRITSAKLSS